MSKKVVNKNVMSKQASRREVIASQILNYNASESRNEFAFKVKLYIDISIGYQKEARCLKREPSSASIYF